MPETSRPRRSPCAATCIRLSRILFLIVCCVVVPARARPAPDAPPTGLRPRVGLVLSGGGARGAAHIGVLRALETLRVPVDVIAGTSMGAVVGGLYASGMSADELEATLESIDWRDIFRDPTPRQELSFRRKQDDLSFLTRIELGFRGGAVALPRGLIQGQKLGARLRELTLSVNAIQDFDALPIPFRAVATDIADAEPVVIGSGDLAAAMRASMSVPGVLAPVERDGRLLVDGGLVDNLPVDVAMRLGADVLIAVDISTPLLAQDELDSALAISAQVLYMLTLANTQAQVARLRPGDVLITPDLRGFRATDFEGAARVIPFGEEATRAAAAALEPYALSPERYAEYRAARAIRRRAPPHIDAVRVVNDSALAGESLERRVASRPGEPLDLEVLRRDLATLYGLGVFESVRARVEEGPERSELVIEAREKSWGPHYVRFGLNLEEDFDGSSDYNVAVNYTMNPVNRLGAEWRNELQFGAEMRVFSELYQPLDHAGRYFVAPTAEYDERNVSLFDPDGRRLAEFRVRETSLGLAAGRQLGNWGELRFGAAWSRGRAGPRIGSPSLPRVELEDARGFVRFAYDRLDNPRFPRSGTFATLGLSVVSDLETDLDTYSLLRGEWTRAESFGPNTLLLGVRLETSLDDEAAINDFFRLGGFLNLSGFARDELAGRHAGLARLIAYRRLAAPALLGFELPFYAGASLEAGNVFQDRDEIDFQSLRFGGSAFVGADTLLGPIYLGYGLAETGKTSAYLFLGRTF